MNNIINGNEGYLGNPLVKRDGIVQAWTQQEILEYQKCMQNPAYFARTYCKIISLNEGLVPFELYDYQEQMFNHFNDNRFSIVLACRQSGKSISSVAYLLWYALFNSEKNIAILANKGATAREMLSRVTLMLENLPFFLQPGTKTLNKGSIEFGNNSKILAAATSGSSIRGLSISLLFLDEFAFIENATEFYTSTYPVISSGKDTKVIITSTANGIGNQFYNIWQGSIQKTNAFKSFRVDWWDVPGRDDKWKLETVANTSQLQFDQEFGNTFFGTGDTLIGAEALMGMKSIDPVHIFEGGDLLMYNEPAKNHEYVITVDVAKGRGQDYSTFNVLDVTSKPFNQVAVYRCNSISPILFPDIIYKYANSYNKAYVIVESNDHGVLVTRGLYHELEYENMHMSSVIKSDGIGVEMTRKTKRLGCSGIKDIIENNKLKINDVNTIVECSTFVARGQSYEASPGNHDDLMMNLVMFGYFATTEMFTDMTDINLKQFMFEERARAIEEDVVFAGFYDNGSEHMSELQRREDMGKPWAVDYDQTDF
tara:strand:+ start:4122 stop:5738 length:1617 start_codon:yes stop_codon:yes gene_type:complete